MNEVTPYRVLDVGAAKLALRSPIARLHADLDRVYPHLPETTDGGFADVRVSLLLGSPLRLRGRQQLPGDRPWRPRWRRGQCVAFYSYKDIEKLEKFLQGKPVAEQEIGRQLLADTVSFAETSMCRRRFLLHYFGEELPGDNCGHCDNCLNPKETYDASEGLEILLKVLKESKERHRAKFICDLLVGNQTSEVQKYKANALPSFGKGDEHDAHYWLAMIRQATVGGFLIKDIETYGNLSAAAAWPATGDSCPGRRLNSGSRGGR